MKIKNNFKIIPAVLIVLAAIVLDLSVTACSNVSGGGGGGNKDFTTFTIDPVGVNINERKDLAINITPSDGVTYAATSDDTNTATVTVDGGTVTVTGIASGETTISVTAKKNGYNSKTVTVLVSVGIHDFTKFNIAPVSVEKGSSIDLAIDIDPSDGVTYTAVSDDTNTATVTVNGSTITVTGLADGATTVSVTATKEGYNNKTVTVPVTVTNPALPNFNSFTISDVSMYMGDSKNLSITIDPSDGVTYTAVSGDDSVATVSVNGSNVAVTGTKDGTTTVSVTAKKDGYNSMTVTADVTVTLKNFNSLTISPASVEVKSGESTTLTVSSDPSGEGVTYTAVPVDASKAEVTVSGSTVTVKGKGAGSTTVSVTAKKDGYNDMTVTADVTVKPVDFKSFSIAPTSVGLEKSKNLSITIDPSDGVTYTAVSGDDSVATVSVNGSNVAVTGTKDGTTTVSVTAKKDGYNDTTVNANVEVKSIPMVGIPDKNFSMGETEITQKQYQEILEWAQGNDAVKSKYPKIEQASTIPSWFSDRPPATGEKQENRPVEQVTWYDAVMYCNLLTMREMGESECVYDITNIEYRYPVQSFLWKADVKMVNGWENKKGYRLPTHDEWIYAAKAGTDYKYAGTSDDEELKEYAWFNDNSDEKTHEVKKKKPNGYGLYDMSGNVCEWSNDYSVGFGPPHDKKYNPAGSYRMDAGWCKVEQYFAETNMNIPYVGFRVVRNK